METVSGFESFALTIARSLSSGGSLGSSPAGVAGCGWQLASHSFPQFYTGWTKYATRRSGGTPFLGKNGKNPVTGKLFQQGENPMED